MLNTSKWLAAGALTIVVVIGVAAVATQRRETGAVPATELAAMAEPTSVLLDVRSPGAFAQWHLRGAVNLPLTDWTVETLARAIPSKDTNIYELGPALQINTTALPIVGTWEWAVPNIEVPTTVG
jgi:Rhodanese-like domain